MTELRVTFPNKLQSSRTCPGSKCAGLCTNEKMQNDQTSFSVENL